jgi:serine/threonine protein kinase
MTGGSQEALAEALGERYAIERELARGGMATIYLARDADRGEQVAVKLMDPKLARAVGVERFLREIDIVRSVTHPLIVPLYESGTAGAVHPGGITLRAAGAGPAPPAGGRPPDHA